MEEYNNPTLCDPVVEELFKSKNPLAVFQFPDDDICPSLIKIDAADGAHWQEFANQLAAAKMLTELNARQNSTAADSKFQKQEELLDNTLECKPGTRCR